MSKVKKASASLMGLVDSDDDEDILSSAQKPTQKPTRPAAAATTTTTTTTTTAPAKRANATVNATAKTRGATATATAPTTRKALTEKLSNSAPPEKTMTGRGRKRAAPEDAPPPPPPPAARGRRNGNAVETNSKSKGTRGRPKATRPPKVAVEENRDDEVSDTQPEPVAQPPARRGRKPKAKVDTPPAAEREIPETQQPDPEIPETQHVEPEEMNGSADEDEQHEDPPAHNRAQPPSLFSASRRRAAATSDANPDPSDPSARKRVGDLTRKYQELEAKYRDLREVGVLEAERNYDKLKKQSEEKANSEQDLQTPLALTVTDLPPFYF